MTLLPLILCEKSIARIPEAWKRFLDPENFKKFPKKLENFDFSSVFLGDYYLKNRKTRKWLYRIVRWVERNRLRGRPLKTDVFMTLYTLLKMGYFFPQMVTKCAFCDHLGEKIPHLQKGVERHEHIRFQWPTPQSIPLDSAHNSIEPFSGFSIF